MPSPENGRYSYVRMLREIVPSDSLRSFRAAAHEYAFDDGFYGFADGTVPEIYPVNSLRITLFERRAKVGEHVAELLRLDDYLTKPEHIFTERVRSRPGGPLKTVRKSRVNPLKAALDEADPTSDQGILYARADDIIDCTKMDYRHHGTELALRIAPSEAAEALDLQSQLIIDAAMRTYAGRALPRPAEPDDPRQIPFMRAHFRSPADLSDYMDLLRQDLPVTDIGCMPIGSQRTIRQG